MNTPSFRRTPVRQLLLQQVVQVFATLLVLLAVALPSRAAVVISADTTIDYAVNDHVEVIGSATVTLVTGGAIFGGVTARDTSTVNVAGGSISGTVAAVDAGKVNVSGGSIGEHLLILSSTSVARIAGGSIAGIASADGFGRIHYSGGSIGEELRVYGGSVVHVYGSDLSLDEINFPEFLLTGVLEDGTPLNLHVAFLKNDQYEESIVLHEVEPVPEISDLGEQVEELASGGTLTGSEAHALKAKLAAAAAALALGNEEAAAGALGAFIKQVESLVRSGRLSATEGQALIEAAEAILSGLG